MCAPACALFVFLLNFKIGLDFNFLLISFFERKEKNMKLGGEEGGENITKIYSMKTF